MENVEKIIVPDANKVYIQATIKLGLKNFSTAEISVGISQSIKDPADFNTIADKLFEETVMPKVQDFASKLASITYKMASVIESMKEKEAR